MPDFKSLRVTPLIRDAVSDIYRITATFPDSERYGLASQMRRAAVSIGANLAEGTGRSSDCDFARFVQIARGSSHELADVPVAHIMNWEKQHVNYEDNPYPPPMVSHGAERKVALKRFQKTKTSPPNSLRIRPIHRSKP